MKSVLMIGQSNMAGRGFLNEVPMICNERIQMLRNGRWQMMAFTSMLLLKERLVYAIVKLSQKKKTFWLPWKTKPSC